MSTWKHYCKKYIMKIEINLFTEHISPTQKSEPNRTDCRRCIYDAGSSREGTIRTLKLVVW